MENKTFALSHSIRPTFNIMKLTFGIVPIVAGLDKFTNLLTNWEQYVHPGIMNNLPFAPHTFMMIVGIIEIGAGVLVLLNPKVGGLVVAAWLTVIALTLLAGGHFIDVAVRDFVMAIGAFTMTQVAKYVSYNGSYERSV